jgi:hypothetical protein
MPEAIFTSLPASAARIDCCARATQKQQNHLQSLGAKKRLYLLPKSSTCLAAHAFFFLWYPAPRSRGGGDQTLPFYGIGLTELGCYSLAPVKSQRWQHILIQAASPLLMPLMVSNPFPHFHTFLPVLQAPSSLRPNFGRFVGPRDGATATYQGGGNSDIILDSAK